MAEPTPRDLERLELEVPAAGADDLVAELGALFPAGFEQQERGLQAPGSTEQGPPPGVTRFVLYLAADANPDRRAALEALVARHRQRFGEELVRLRATAVPAQDWREIWKQHFKIQHIDDFVIQPSWLPYTPAQHEHLIHLDPGAAFGTGLHESTRLCLKEIGALIREGAHPRRVLDFGCGTGILAVAACLQWPSCSADAVDNDEAARAATDENARRNQLAERITVHARLPSDDGPTRGYDLVCANIQLSVLKAHAEALVALTRPAGHLVLAGLLIDQAPAAAAAFGRWGARRRADRREGEWIALRLQREAP
jgi:ribosomal protein L11 methyltransferase